MGTVPSRDGRGNPASLSSGKHTHTKELQKSRLRAQPKGKRGSDGRRRQQDHQQQHQKLKQQSRKRRLRSANQPGHSDNSTAAEGNTAIMWSVDSHRNVLFPLDLAPHFDNKFYTFGRGPALKEMWTKYREYPAPGLQHSDQNISDPREKIFSKFSDVLYDELKQRERNKNGEPAPPLTFPHDVAYGMNAWLRCRIGLDKSRDNKGKKSGVEKYCDMTLSVLRSNLQQASYKEYPSDPDGQPLDKSRSEKGDRKHPNNNATLFKADIIAGTCKDMCLIVEIMRMLSSTPHTRSIFQLVRLPSLIAGILKAALTLHNSVMMSDIQKDLMPSDSDVWHTDTQLALNSLRKLVLSLSCLFCTLTECCGSWRYSTPQHLQKCNSVEKASGGIRSSGTTHDYESVACEARRQVSAAFAPYFIDELIDAIKLLMPSNEYRFPKATYFYTLSVLYDLLGTCLASSTKGGALEYLQKRVRDKAGLHALIQTADFEIFAGVEAKFSCTHVLKHLQIMALHVLREALRGCETNILWINDFGAHKIVSNVIICGMKSCLCFGDTIPAYEWGKENDWFEVSGDFLTERQTGKRELDLTKDKHIVAWRTVDCGELKTAEQGGTQVGDTSFGLDFVDFSGEELPSNHLVAQNPHLSSAFNAIFWMAFPRREFSSGLKCAVKNESEQRQSAEFVIKVILSLYCTTDSKLGLPLFLTESGSFGSISLQSHLEVVSILTNVVSQCDIVVILKLFRQYRVWDLLLSEVFGFTAIQFSKSLDKIPSPTFADNADKLGHTLQDEHNRLQNQHFLLAHGPNKEDATKLAKIIELQRQILSLFRSMVLRAASNSEIDSVAQEIRDIVTAIERVVTSSLPSDTATLQLSYCLLTVVEDCSSEKISKGIIHSHMLPQLIFCATRQLQDTINPRTFAVKAESVYIQQSEDSPAPKSQIASLSAKNVNIGGAKALSHPVMGAAKNSDQDTNARPADAQANASPLGVHLRGNYFPPPISSNLGRTSNPDTTLRNRSAQNNSVARNKKTETGTTYSLEILWQSGYANSETRNTLLSTEHASKQRPLLWKARKVLLCVLKSYFGLQQNLFEAMSYALYHDAHERAQSSVAPLTTLIFDLLSENGRPSIKESLSILRSMLFVSTLFLERVSTNTLKGPLKLATAGDNIRNALSELHNYIFKMTSQFIGLVFHEKISDKAVKVLTGKKNAQSQVTYIPKVDRVASIKLFLEMIQSLSNLRVSTKKSRLKLCHNGIVKQIVTVGHQCQSLPPTAQLEMITMVLRTLTSLMMACTAAKEYVMYEVGYQQIHTLVLLSRVDNIVPTCILSQMEAMVFDQVNPIRHTAQLTNTSDAVSSKIQIDTEIKNIGALSAVIAVLPHVSKQDQTSSYRLILSCLKGPFALQNCSMCGNADPPILDQVLNALPWLANDSTRLLAISVLEVLGAHNISVSSLKLLLRSLQSPDSATQSYRPNLAPRLIRAIRNMIPQDASPREFFYFDGISSGLYLPDLKKWPSNGYSISMWVKYSPERGIKQTLLSFCPSPDQGLELFFEGGILSLRVIVLDSRQKGHRLDSFRRKRTRKRSSKHTNEKFNKRASEDRENSANSYVYASDFEFDNSWHFIALTQKAPGFIGSKSSAKIYVDNQCVWKASIPYLTSTLRQTSNPGEQTGFYSIGTGVPSFSNSDKNEQEGKGMRFCGCMSSFRMFNESLSSVHLLDVYNLGYNYFGVFDSAEDLVQSTWERSTELGAKSRLMDETLAKAVILAYNAGVSYSGGFASIAYNHNHIGKGIGKYKGKKKKMAIGSYEKIISSEEIDILGLAKAVEGTHAVKLHHVRDVLDSLGGIKILFPIFAQFSLPDEDGNYTPDPKLAVEVIELIGAMLKYDAKNHKFNMTRGFSLIAYLLEQVSPEYMTIEFATSIAKLCANVDFPQKYVDEVTKSLLTNSRLWVFAPLQTQMYVFNLVAEEAAKAPSRFASPKILGVQRILVTLQLYYWVEEPVSLSSTDKWVTAKTLRHPVTDKIIGRRLEGEKLLKARSALFRILDIIFLCEYSHLKTDYDKFTQHQDTTKSEQQRNLADIECLMGTLASSTCAILQEGVLTFVLNLFSSADNRAKFFVKGLASFSTSSSFDVAAKSILGENRLAGLSVFIFLLSSSNNVIRSLALRVIGRITSVARSMSPSPIASLSPAFLPSFTTVIIRELRKNSPDHRMYLAILDAIIGIPGAKLWPHQSRSRNTTKSSVAFPETSGSNLRKSNYILIKYGGTNDDTEASEKAERNFSSSVPEEGISTMQLVSPQERDKNDNINGGTGNPSEIESNCIDVAKTSSTCQRQEPSENVIADTSQSRISRWSTDDLNDIQDLKKDKTEKNFYAIAQCKVNNPEFLRILCQMLTNRASIEIQTRALEDISLLLTQRHNMEAILKQFGWQQWFLDLLSTFYGQHSRSSRTLIDHVLSVFRLLHLHAVRRSDVYGGGNKIHQGGCEVLANTLMHVRRFSGLNQIDSLSLSSAILQQLLHAVQREILGLREEITLAPDSSIPQNQLRRLLGSTWHIAFFVSDQIHFPAPSPANAEKAVVTPAKSSSKRGSIRELSEAKDTSPARLVFTPRFEIVSRQSPDKIKSKSEKNITTKPHSLTTVEESAPDKLQSLNDSNFNGTESGVKENSAMSGGARSELRYIDSGMQLVDGLLRLLIDSKLDLWSEAPLNEKSIHEIKSRGAQLSRPGGALRIVVHLIVDSVRDSLNFSLMHESMASNASEKGRAAVISIDAEQVDYLNYLEQLFMRSRIAENVTNLEWQRSLMLATASLANIARFHCNHFNRLNEVHRVLLSLVTLYPALFIHQLQGLDHLDKLSIKSASPLPNDEIPESLAKVLKDMKAIVGVNFTWGDWDHAIGFVVTEEMELQSELAKLVADDQFESMTKIESLMSTLSRTERKYSNANSIESIEMVFNDFANSNAEHLQRTLRWQIDSRELASQNWYRVLRDLTAERGLWGQTSTDQNVFWILKDMLDPFQCQRLLIRNYRGSNHDGRQPNMKRSNSSKSSISTKNAQEPKPQEESLFLLWQQVRASAALRFQNTDSDPDADSDLHHMEKLGEVASSQSSRINESNPGSGFIISSEDNSSVSSDKPEHSIKSSGHSNYDMTLPLLSLPCDFILPMLELSATLEVYENMFWIIVDQDAIDSLSEDTKTLLNPQRLHKRRFDSLRDISSRRYEMQHIAIEFFFGDGSTCFLSMRDKTAYNKLVRSLKRLLPTGITPYLGLSPKEALKRSGATQAWQKRKISNFDYLMLLNRFAGRTYQDLGQYPVFPWIIRDYESNTLDLSDPKVFRDLSKPMGAQTKEREEVFRERYRVREDMWNEVNDINQMVLDGPPHHYGSHYSTAGYVIWYLMRMEPFTSQHILLQSGKFDKPNRQMLGIMHAWKGATATKSQNDVKELIPEFFYQPEAFMNGNNIDFGTRTDGIQLGDIELPPWAKTPEDFVRLHREALESEYVSLNLHHWIDLIFGQKQRPPFLKGGSEKAVEACNVFFHAAYEGAIDMDYLKENESHLVAPVLSMMKEFGQIPSQLFTRAHPRRSALTDVIFPMFSDVLGLPREKVGNKRRQFVGVRQRSAIGRPRGQRLSLSRKTSYSLDGPPLQRPHSSAPEITKLTSAGVVQDRNPAMRPSSIMGYPIVHLNPNRVPMLLAKIMPAAGRLVTVDASRILGLHRWTSKDPDIEPPFSLEIDPSNILASRWCHKMYRPRSKAPAGPRLIGTPFARSIMAGRTTQHDKVSFNSTTKKTTGNTLLLGSTFCINMRCFAVLDTLGIVFSCGHCDTTFRATEVETGKTLQSISYHHGIVTCLDVSHAEGSTIQVGSSSVQAVLVTGSEDCTVAVWGVQSSWRTTTRMDTKRSTNSMDDSSLRQNSVSTSSKGIKEFAKSGRPIAPFPIVVLYGHDAPITAVSVSASQGVVVSTSADGTAIVYALSDGSYIRTIGRSLFTYKFSKSDPLNGPGSAVTSTLKVPAASSELAKSTSIDVQQTSLGTNTLRVEVTTENEVGYATWVGISPVSGAIVIYYEECSIIRVYSLNGKLQTETEVNEQLNAFQFSEDGNYLLTGGSDCVIKVFDVLRELSIVKIIDGKTRPSPLTPSGLPPFEDHIYSMSYSPGERHLLVGLGNGTVRIFALDAQYLRDRLQGRLNSLGF